MKQEISKTENKFCKKRLITLSKMYSNKESLIEAFHKCSKSKKFNSKNFALYNTSSKIRIFESNFDDISGSLLKLHQAFIHQTQKSINSIPSKLTYSVNKNYSNNQSLNFSSNDSKSIKVIDPENRISNQSYKNKDKNQKKLCVSNTIDSNINCSNSKRNLKKYIMNLKDYDQMNKNNVTKFIKIFPKKEGKLLFKLNNNNLLKYHRNASKKELKIIDKESKKNKKDSESTIMQLQHRVISISKTQTLNKDIRNKTLSFKNLTNINPLVYENEFTKSPTQVSSRKIQQYEKLIQDYKKFCSNFDSGSMLGINKNELNSKNQKNNNEEIKKLMINQIDTGKEHEPITNEFDIVINKERQNHSISYKIKRPKIKSFLNIKKNISSKRPKSKDLIRNLNHFIPQETLIQKDSINFPKSIIQCAQYLI